MKAAVHEGGGVACGQSADEACRFGAMEAGGECAREALPAWAAGGKLVGKLLLPQGACKCSVPTEREL